MPYKDYENTKASVRARYHERVHGVPNTVRRPFRSPEEKAEFRAAYLKDYYTRPEVKLRARDRELQRIHGITWEQKILMYQEQDGLCGFCGLPLHPEISKAHVDHNHETGEVRKLLHKQCNTLVAAFEKQPELVDKIREYLCPSKV